MFTTRRFHLLALAFFALVALVITWPLLTVLSTHFAGYAFGDAHEMTRHIWWFTEALREGQPLIFQPLLGYPDGMQGVILWSDPLQFFPGWLLALFLPLPAAYNLQALLNLALNGWAAYFLIWKLLTSTTTVEEQRVAAYLSALVAGVVFMAAPMIQGHLAGGHGGLLVQWPLPLLAWSLLRVTGLVVPPEAKAIRLHEESPLKGTENPLPDNQPPHHSSLITHYSSLSTKHLALSTLFFVLTPLGHTLQLIYAVLPLVGVIGLTVLVRRDWRALLRLALVSVVGGGLLTLFLLPVFSATLGTGAYVDEGGGVAYSLDLLGLVTPSFNHPLFGGWDYTHRVLGLNIVEGSAYVGVVAFILGIIALWKSCAARWWLLPALVAWVLALGPLLKLFDAPLSLQNNSYSTFVTLPWAFLGDLPILSLARTPGRFGFLLALCVAVLAGYGTQTVLSFQFSVFRKQPANKPLKFLAVGLLIALTLYEYQSFWPLPTYPAAIPDAVRAVATREDVRAVFDMPWDNLLAAKDALWLQTAHEKPMIAGQVTRRTPVDPAKLMLLEGTLNPALLDEAGADILILHKQYDAEGKIAQQAWDLFGTPFYEDESLALWERPAVTQTAAFETVIPASQTSANPLNFYLYAPESGWVNFDYTLTIQPGQTADLLLDGQIIHHLTPESASGEMGLPIATPGYHTLSLSIKPACPLLTTVPCTHPQIERAEFGAFEPTVFPDSIVFDHGLTLMGWQLNEEAVFHPETERHTVQVSLWWRFDQPRGDQDVRFMHILDVDGRPAGQFDESLGVHAAGTDWVETWELEIAGERQPGATFTFCTGWYTYPDLTRFPVLSDVPGAQDGLACLGAITIP